MNLFFCIFLLSINLKSLPDYLFKINHVEDRHRRAETASPTTYVFPLHFNKDNISPGKYGWTALLSSPDNRLCFLKIKRLQL